MIGIYKITNQINGKCYVGQSINITDRWRRHRAAAKVENNSIYKAIRKYGIENFSFEVIEECDKEELNEKEKYWIEYYNSFKEGYNETEGGDGTSGHPMKISEEQLQQIIQLLKETNLTQREIASRFNVGEDTISEINHGKTRFQKEIDYPIRKKPVTFQSILNNEQNTNSNFQEIKQEENKCPLCGIIIGKDSKYCLKCSHKLLRKVERPERNVLKQKIRTQSFLQIGKEYGVSDNAVRKWCVSYGLPSKKTIIKTYTDQEWDEELFETEGSLKKTKKEPIPNQPVRCLDILTKEIIKDFTSYTQAAAWILQENLSKSDQHNIAIAIRRSIDRDGTAYGYKWIKINH